MKKIYYWIIGVLLVLIITNPTMQDFKDYKGTIYNDSDSFNLKKKADFIIFSRYDFNQTKFIGLFKNFYKIGYTESPITLKDTAKKTDTVPPLPKGYTPIK